MKSLRSFSASAPGRLDLLGGVADFSGSLVLTTPIRPETTVSVERDDSGILTLESDGFPPARMEAYNVFQRGSEAELRACFDEADLPGWARFIIACLHVLNQDYPIAGHYGLRFSVASDVPDGLGVGSSAALEVATLRALNGLFQLRLSSATIARLSQQAEKRVEGSMGALMDPLAIACGEHGEILPILCRPDTLRPPITLPDHIRVIGWPSGVRHSVRSSGYLVARTATFMGKRIFEEETGIRFEFAAEIPPETLRMYAGRVPEAIPGSEFLERYGDVEDERSTVEADRSYDVSNALHFPIAEHARAEAAMRLLAQPSESHLRETGRLLYESHAGYSSIGLGSPETDQMTDALRKLGPNNGVFGARVSGGGAGGTVVILATEDAIPALEELASDLYFGKEPLPLIR